MKASDVDLAATVGSVRLKSAILTASGTSGHDAELGAYGDLAELGGVVVKSLSVEAWPGNPAPRVVPAGEGMVNAVGLQGPGVDAWRRDGLPRLLERNATVVASIWGRTVDEFAEAAEALHGAQIAALEVNVSCPNLHDGSRMFAHSPAATAEAVQASQRAGVPCWVKLSPNTDRLVDVARSAIDAGAEALVLVNTLRALVVDVERRTRVLGAGSGGLSGAPLHPIALHWVAACHDAMPDVAIVGVGGVRSAREVVAFVLAGAAAVEVGTASLADPRAPWRVIDDTKRWCARHDVATLAEMRGHLDG
ncbi:MAG TPA: dihydroorotate dehydrogenase [Acidimicrobiales bacterium]|jgi:dihydroorotate dehydrogenase (NAD+) catalytic subunit